MNFSCDKCQRRYSIADEKVRGKTVKVRCKNCQNIISVEGPPQAVEESTRVVSLADVERLRSQLLEESEAMPAAASASEPLAAQGPWEEPGRPASATEPALESPLEPPLPASSAWFVMVRGQQEGPLEEPALRELVSSGDVTPRSYFWQQGMEDWKRGSDIAELASLFEPAARPAGRAPPRPPPEEPPAPTLDENLPPTRPHSAASLGLEDVSRKPTVQWDNTEVTVRRRMEEVAEEEALEQEAGRRKPAESRAAPERQPTVEERSPAGRRHTHETEARSAAGRKSTFESEARPAAERRASPEVRRPAPEVRVTSEIPASERARLLEDEGESFEELPQRGPPVAEARRHTAELPAAQARRPPTEGTVTGVRKPPTEGTATGVRRPGEVTGSRRLTEDTASVRLGALFSDLDLPQGEEQEQQGAVPDPFAEAAQEPPLDEEPRPPEENTRFYMRQSGVDRRNPPWKIALFVVLVLALPVGALYALTELQVVPLRAVHVDAKGNQVEQPVSLFSAEGVAGLRDLLMGRQQPPLPPPPPPRPRPEAAAPRPEPKPEVPAEPAAPSAEEQKKLAELYGADKQDAAPQVREGAEVAAADSTRASGPSKAALDQVVDKAQRSFQDCMNRLLKDNRSFRGLEVNITATVAMTGRVKQATFDSREVERSKLGECLKARVMKLPFPAFSGEDVEVEIPLVLKQTL